MTSFAWIGALPFPILVVYCLQADFFTVFGNETSGRDSISIGGGILLLAKSTLEIHHKLEGQNPGPETVTKTSFTSVIVQILLLGVVFSFDSVITALGKADQIAVMVAAVVIAVGFR